MIYALTDPRCGHTLAATTHRPLAQATLDLLWSAGRTDIPITDHPDTLEPDDLHPARPDCPGCVTRAEGFMAAVYRRDLVRTAEWAGADPGKLVDYFTSLTVTSCCDRPPLDAHDARRAAQAALEQGLIPAAAPVVLEPAMFSEA